MPRQVVPHRLRKLCCAPEAGHGLKGIGLDARHRGGCGGCSRHFRREMGGGGLVGGKVDRGG
eukprot:2098068-Alexandrium_andersonii.AAC.1